MGAWVESAVAAGAAEQPAAAIRPVIASPAARALGGCAAVLAGFSLVAQRPGTLPSLAEQMGLVALLIVPSLLVPLYWHRRGSAERRDAALTIAWGLLTITLLKQAILTATAWKFPLWDAIFRGWDVRLGIELPAILAWDVRHPVVTAVLARSYGMLSYMMLCALLLTALAGRRAAAERFVLANAFGFVLALPCFLWMPAIGPWVAWHVDPSPGQHVCEVTIQGVRAGLLTMGTSVGASVCLPSFHAFWAVVSAQALWTFRWIRIPAAVLAGLIVASTLTTGWHYGVDTLSGVVLAAMCGALAWLVVRRQDLGCTRVIAPR